MLWYTRACERLHGRKLITEHEVRIGQTNHAGNLLFLQLRGFADYVSKTLRIEPYHLVDNVPLTSRNVRKKSRNHEFSKRHITC